MKLAKRDNIPKILAYGFLLSLIIGCLVLIFNPYLILPSVSDTKQIPWTKPNEETPKAVIQFTFTSKVAFTTNYPIHVKVEILLLKEENENDTNLVIGIVNPPAQAYKTPLSEYPYSALIWMSTDGLPRTGELDVEFTASGSYGFFILSGVLPELTNMTVAFVYNSALIEIEPYNIRFTSEWAIRAISIPVIFSCIGIYLERDKISSRIFNKKRKTKRR
jgi:hypothetical protein